MGMHFLTENSQDIIGFILATDKASSIRQNQKREKEKVVMYVDRDGGGRNREGDVISERQTDDARMERRLTKKRMQSILTKRVYVRKI